MFEVKCGRLSSVQLGLTPQESRSDFRINMERTKEHLEPMWTHTRIDVVEISPEGYQRLANAIASGSLDLDQVCSRQDRRICQEQSDQVCNPPV